jgi:hypothetical protein
MKMTARTCQFLIDRHIPYHVLWGFCVLEHLETAPRFNDCVHCPNYQPGPPIETMAEYEASWKDTDEQIKAEGL